MSYDYYCSAIVTIAVSCIVSEMKRYIGRKTAVCHANLSFNLQDHLERLGISCQILTQNVRFLELLDGAKILLTCPTFCVGSTNVTETDRRRRNCDDIRRT